MLECSGCIAGACNHCNRHCIHYHIHCFLNYPEPEICHISIDYVVTNLNNIFNILKNKPLKMAQFIENIEKYYYNNMKIIDCMHYNDMKKKYDKREQEKKYDLPWRKNSGEF